MSLLGWGLNEGRGKRVGAVPPLRSSRLDPASWSRSGFVPAVGVKAGCLQVVVIVISVASLQNVAVTR